MYICSSLRFCFSPAVVLRVVLHGTPGGRRVHAAPRHPGRNGLGVDLGLSGPETMVVSWESWWSMDD